MEGPRNAATNTSHESNESGEMADTEEQQDPTRWWHLARRIVREEVILYRRRGWHRWRQRFNSIIPLAAHTIQPL
jgi:hypothetical protein